MAPDAAGPGLAGLVLWFILIVGLIPLTLWLIKRSPWGSRLGGALPGTLGGRLGLAAPAHQVQVLGNTTLGPGQRLVVVEVQSGAQTQTLLLGVTAHTITPVSVLPAGVGSRLSETA